MNECVTGEQLLQQEDEVRILRNTIPVKLRQVLTQFRQMLLLGFNKLSNLRLIDRHWALSERCSSLEHFTSATLAPQIEGQADLHRATCYYLHYQHTKGESVEWGIGRAQLRIRRDALFAALACKLTHFQIVLKHVRREVINSICDYHLIGIVHLNQRAEIDEFDLLYIFLILVQFYEDVLRSHVAIYHVHLLNLSKEEANFLDEYGKMLRSIFLR